MKTNYHIDNIDLKILSILSKNAKMPYTEVAKKNICIRWNCSCKNEEIRENGYCKRNKITN